MTPAVLDKPRAAEYLSLGLTSFEQGVQRGTIPKPRQLTSRRVGWLTKDLDKWAEGLPVSECLPVANCGGNQ